MGYLTYLKEKMFFGSFPCHLINIRQLLTNKIANIISKKYFWNLSAFYNTRCITHTAPEFTYSMILTTPKRKSYTKS